VAPTPARTVKLSPSFPNKLLPHLVALTTARFPKSGLVTTPSANPINLGLINLAGAAKASQ
jgi:hypothetical protein